MANPLNLKKSYWPIPLKPIPGCLAFQAQQRLSETITQAGCQRNEAWGELTNSHGLEGSSNISQELANI